MTQAHRATAALTALLLVVAAGCTGASSVAPDTLISVRNSTGDSIAISVFEREQSYLVDPVPELAASEERDRLIVPGGERRVQPAQVYGYSPGKDVRIFLYRIRLGRSVFVAIRDVSAASLRSSGNVVVIEASAFSTR